MVTSWYNKRRRGYFALPDQLFANFKGNFSKTESIFIALYLLEMTCISYWSKPLRTTGRKTEPF